ncbi:hypothetical protein BJV78DRAFT_1255589 [Lactifluus subvellereus]|nr:hypothetical protein BJV78DRAFT_1255589 [Lactifluus subvellereus]
MLAITTVVLGPPCSASSTPCSRITSPSPSTSAPPVRRISARGVPSAVPPPLVIPQQASTSPIETSSGSLPRGTSDASLRASREDGFNGALYSLKAFSIATALVVTSGAASVWGVKTYLGVKDWPLFTSRIHRASESDSAPLSPPVSLSITIPTTSAPQNVPPPTAAVPDVDGWNWPATEARLAAEVERRKRGLSASSELLAEDRRRTTYS